MPRFAGAKLHKSYNSAARVTVNLNVDSQFFSGDIVTTNVLALPRREKPNFVTTIVLIILHVGAIAALFMFSWNALLAVAASCTG